MPDLSSICDLHHSSQQCQIPNPLSEARDQTHNFMVTGWICFLYAMMGTPIPFILKAPTPIPLLSLSSVNSVFYLSEKTEAVYFFSFLRLFSVALWHMEVRGQIGAVANGLHHNHSNGRSEPYLTFTTAQGNSRSFNPLSEAGDRTWVLMDTSWVCYRWAITESHNGNSRLDFYSWQKRHLISFILLYNFFIFLYLNMKEGTSEGLPQKLLIIRTKETKQI